MADDTAPRRDHQITLGLARKSLEATVIYACPQCGAAGVLNGRPVGEVCPQCGGLRRKDRFLGELAASLPLWLWKLVLASKWCLVKAMSAFT